MFTQNNKINKKNGEIPEGPCVAARHLWTLGSVGVWLTLLYLHRTIRHHVKLFLNLKHLKALCCKCLIHAILSQSSEPLLQRVDLQISVRNDLIYSQK